MMRLVVASIGHLVEFRRTVREIDLEEIKKISGLSFDDQPLETLAGCLALIDDHNAVLGLGGVENNVIWLVTTTAIENRKIEFLRFSKKYLQELLEVHGHLWNYAYTKNQLHIDWLTWLGADWIESKGDFALFILKRKE